jgi:hypothetical protein
MISMNCEDKIQFIKDDLGKKSLNNLLLTIKIHLSRDVHNVIHDIWPYLNKKIC